MSQNLDHVLPSLGDLPILGSEDSRIDGDLGRVLIRSAAFSYPEFAILYLTPEGDQWRLSFDVAEEFKISHIHLYQVKNSNWKHVEGELIRTKLGQPIVGDIQKRLTTIILTAKHPPVENYSVYAISGSADFYLASRVGNSYISGWFPESFAKSEYLKSVIEFITEVKDTVANSKSEALTNSQEIAIQTAINLFDERTNFNDSDGEESQPSEDESGIDPFAR